MRIDSKWLLPQVQRLYKAGSLREITTGHSGDQVFNAGPHPLILRVSAFSEKKKAHTDFETRWTDYLSSQMDGIAKPFRSLNNRLFEIIEPCGTGGEKYILSAQEKAPGKIVDINNPGEYNEQLFFNLGTLMGRMHGLTKDYEENRRSEFKWNGPHFWRRNIKILDKDVEQAEKRFLRELETLPAGKDSYGIVHYDVHTDNFLVKDNHITLIDFDACQFNWYAADIASALFFMVQRGAGPLKGLSEKTRTEFAETYLISYLRGYLQYSPLNAYWLEKLDLFMRYQMIDEYVAAQISHEPQWYLDWHKDKIINHLPYVSMDYEKINNRINGFPV